MSYWLLKTEPGEYGYHDLEKSGRDTWDGVKNFAALKNMKAMRPGDLAFIYHTGGEKSIAGVAEVVSLPYPDPAHKGLYLIDVEPRYRIGRPVTLSEIKKDPSFARWELVRLSRLSVMPVAPDHWSKVHSMAGQTEGSRPP